jgi:hypothetical protein
MDEQQTFAFVRALMAAFAERTGLVGDRPPRRYLWTDAFAVSNFLALERRLGDGSQMGLARRLVNQVHQVLGRHRGDDGRRGWLSGLAEHEGAAHPTLGGLRIGKPLPERPPDEPFDERLEWERDGQYFHYLARWMHALARLARETGESAYVRWGGELALTAYHHFTFIPRPGAQRRMAWKMSIDLTRPLVAAMGQHDPLDGLVTALELRAAAAALGADPAIDLAAPIADYRAMVAGADLATTDPLGIGGLLSAADTLTALAVEGMPGHADLVVTLLDQARRGLQVPTVREAILALPLRDRLAFRELGLSIGLRALQRIRERLDRDPAARAALPYLPGALDRLRPYDGLVGRIEGFWLDPQNRSGEAWQGHEDISAVMLATSLAPEGYLAP